MINSSTDAYQAEFLKIMSHDYANKYANYWQKKQKVIKTGKANFKDAELVKRLTMQSLLQLQNIVQSIQNAQS